MSIKLLRNTWPQHHGPDDFKCFGPPAEKDGQIKGTMLVDLGCFKQDNVDSNKYYHGAVVQSKQNNLFYAYFEYGRTGASNSSFQFIECSSQSEAQSEYEKQVLSKHTRRGRWEDHSVLGRRLVPKVGKTGKVQDLYIVRPQATRSTGLTDAKTITAMPQKVTVTSNKNKDVFDKESTSLLRDLNIATMQYTRSSMATGAVPTQEAVDEARLILTEASGTTDHKTLVDLTKHLYSRIPKRKGRKEDWVLDRIKIQTWADDLDAFESALNNQDTTTVNVDYPFGLTYFPDKGLGRDIRKWILGASRNRHGHLRNNIKIINLWQIDKIDDYKNFRAYQFKIEAEGCKIDNKPLHQMKERIDLKDKYHKLYKASGTHMLFHGTRSVNVSGILQQSLRMPKASSWGMFGAGIYWADDWRKSHGYTSDSSSYYARGQGGAARRKAFMFVGDVVLGNPWIVSSNSSLCQKKLPKGCHSVFGKGGRNAELANNEFIVYCKEANNLRYLVEFYV